MILPFFTKPYGIFISLTTAALLSGYIAVACAGGDWEDGYGSNFTPETFVSNKSYHPFFFSYLFYYGIYYDTEHNTRFNQTNVGEWQEYLGKNMDKVALDYWLNTASKTEINQLAAYKQGKQETMGTSGRPQKYTLALNSCGSKAPVFARYLALAKACEDFAVSEQRDYWDYEPVQKRVQPANPTLITDLQKEFEAAQDIFVKQRYWFQIIRYYYYFDAPKAIAFFDKHQSSFTPNSLYRRAMAYAAGSYYKQKEYSKANYYYSRVFEADNLMKTVAHFSFHPQEEKDWNQTLALCKNKDEKTTLWQMLGIFYSDESRSIKEIYQLDPQSPKIDLLITRLVNKREQGYNYESGEDIEVENVLDKNGEIDYEATNQKREALYKVQQNKKIMSDLAWIAPIADKENTATPFLWHVATGYLHFLADEPAQATTYYQKAEKLMPTVNTALAKKQIRLLKLLAYLDNLKKIDAKNETDLLADLQWLYQQQPIDSTDQFRCNEAQERVKELLYEKYKAQKDLVKAECFVSHTNFYTNPANVTQLKTFLGKTNKTPFEQFCTHMSPISLDDLWEYEAVLATFAEKIDEAVSYMQKAGSNNAITLLGNPFNGKIKDCHDCDHQAPQKVKYTKLAFLQKMAEMKQKLDRKEDVFNNALLLGNAYYNISHHGNARYFYEGKIIQSAYSPFAIDSSFVQMLTDNATAEKYYRIALQNAADNEQKAKCHYLIAKCERNKWYNENYFSDRRNEYNYEEKQVDFLEWDGFKALKKYADTKYYKDVVNECGYFKEIVKK